MRKFLLPLIFLMLAANSAKVVSPGESTTIRFSLSNPGGQYEFCVDSVLVQFTDYVGDIEITTLMPVYPKVCVCPPSKNSTCLSYATAGKAYAQSYGYSYAPSNTYELLINIRIDPNPTSSLFYPGVPHKYTVQYTYKFVNCKIGCWFENPQQESYSDYVYVYGLTQSQIFAAQTGTSPQQLATAAIGEAQEEVSGAFNEIEQANSSIALALETHCVSAVRASQRISTALGNYSAALSELRAAQSAYASKDYETAKYNATISKQLAISAKSEAGIAITIIQGEIQRVEALSDKLNEANLSSTYAKTLEEKASSIGVQSHEASSLISLAFEYINRTERACADGEYNVVSSSLDSVIDKSKLAKGVLEPLVRNRLAELFNAYAQNLTKTRSQLGNFSSNFSNATIEKLIYYSRNIKNGTLTDYLLYIDMAFATESMLNETASVYSELNSSIGKFQELKKIGNAYKQQLNLTEIETLLQLSVKALSEADFNSSLNLTHQAELQLAEIEKELSNKILKIEEAKNAISVADKTITEISKQSFLVFSPDMGEAESALFRANVLLYSEPQRAYELARQARVLAIEQGRKVESVKLGLAGAVIIIILLALIISRIRYPSRIPKEFRKR
ncbi:MAG: hypothetical protein QXF56_04405 [Candidatus Micrarchaeia archaeon]